ncbi:hypothetical protein HPB50_028157 [Hyalomma asiaticum]|nr:hypothetical protein HPB50_028157 [Hyalomma asiaticum]
MLGPGSPLNEVPSMMEAGQSTSRGRSLIASWPPSEMVTCTPLRSPSGRASDGCTFCRTNGERRSFYMSHTLREHSGPGSKGRVTCPVLRSYQCPQCGYPGGDEAHTLRYCPLNKDLSTRSVYKTLWKSNVAVGTTAAGELYIKSYKTEDEQQVELQESATSPSLLQFVARKANVTEEDLIGRGTWKFNIKMCDYEKYFRQITTEKPFSSGANQHIAVLMEQMLQPSKLGGFEPSGIAAPWIEYNETYRALRPEFGETFLSENVGGHIEPASDQDFKAQVESSTNTQARSRVLDGQGTDTAHQSSKYAGKPETADSVNAVCQQQFWQFIRTNHDMAQTVDHHVCANATYGRRFRKSSRAMTKS